MKRLDCLKAIYPRLEGCAVVTIMGAVAAELYSLGHRPNFFYLEHAMGLASSKSPSSRTICARGKPAALAIPARSVPVAVAVVNHLWPPGAPPPTERRVSLSKMR